MLYEYINGGELWKKSTIYGIHSVDLIRFYFKQVLEGIKHMHSFNIVHRDIKVLLNKNYLLINKFNNKSNYVQFQN